MQNNIILLRIPFWVILIHVLLTAGIISTEVHREKYEEEQELRNWIICCLCADFYACWSFDLSSSILMDKYVIELAESDRRKQTEVHFPGRRYEFH